MGKLLGYIGRYKGALIVVAVCLILSSVGSVAGSYFLKPALNHIVAGDFKGLFWMLVAMGGVFLASAGCSYAYSRLMVRISQRTVATLRQDLFNRLQTLPLRYFDTHQSGDLMSRFTNDMDTVSDMIGNSFASVVSNLITFVCTVFMLIYLNCTDPHHLRVPGSDAPGGQKRGRPQPRQLPAAAGGPGQPQWLH